MASETITIQLTLTASPGSPRVPLEIDKIISAAGLRVEASKATKIPLTAIKLIFRGRLISDDATKQAVTEFKLEDGSVLHCIGKPEEDAKNPPNTTSVATTATPAVYPSVSIVPAAAAADAAPTTVSTSTAAPIDPVKAALQVLRSSNPPNTYQTAVTTLEKVLGNIVDNPMEEKYRKVKKGNPAFQRRLGGVPGGDAAMKAVGFVTEPIDGEEHYVIKASESAWPVLVSNRNTVLAASTGTRSPNNPLHPVPPIPGAFPSLIPPPPTAEAVDQWMTDPSVIQNMMGNPMVRAMLRNDPRFANNPMMDQMLEELAQNPQMASQVSQMMRNPVVRQQMEQLRTLQQQQPPGTEQQSLQDINTSMMNALRAVQSMQQGGQAGTPEMDSVMLNAMLAAAAANNPPPLSNPRQRQSNPTTNSTARPASGNSANDAELTEEEMIAEAIRRSLQDS